MESLKGKKLLILGGGVASCEIVREAHKLGLIVYVTDFLENSPAKKLADKSFMVSTVDIPGVVDLCQREGVDGIFTGYTDSLLPAYCKICQQLKLPHWGNQENIQICIDKRKFKESCLESGVPTIPSIVVHKSDYAEKSDRIRYPVVVKPVDNSGSRGVFKCYTREDYLYYCDLSFGFSKKGELLVERMMNVNNEVSAYYMLHNGEYVLSNMGDRYVDVVDIHKAPQPKGMLFPSVHVAEWLKKVDSPIRNFFEKNRMMDGFVFIQSFYEKGEFFVNEIGYRLNGGFTYKFVEHFSGYNQIQQLLYFSITGRMDWRIIKRGTPQFKGIGFLVTVSLKTGTIAAIDGIDAVTNNPNVLDFVLKHKVGDVVNAPGTSLQVLGNIVCVTENKEQLDETIKYIKYHLSVRDLNGGNMLVGIIDSNIIRVN